MEEEEEVEEEEDKEEEEGENEVHDDRSTSSRSKQSRRYRQPCLAACGVETASGEIPIEWTARLIHRGSVHQMQIADGGLSAGAHVQVAGHVVGVERAWGCVDGAAGSAEREDAPGGDPDVAGNQGLTLVHFSAQPEPLYSLSD